MTCMEAQALITPFINDKLDITQLEDFLDHVEECKDCMEELRVYFALLTAMRQLDENEEISSDFDKELRRKIKDAQEKILHAKIVHIRKRVLFFAMVIAIGLLTSVSFGVVEEALNEDKEIKFNRTVMNNEVLSPYMDSVLLEHLITYQQLQDEITRQQEEKELKEALEQAAEKKKREQQQKEQMMISKKNAEEAYEQSYVRYGIYSREYETASNYMKARYDKLRAEEKGRNIPETPMEFSR